MKAHTTIASRTAVLFASSLFALTACGGAGGNANAGESNATATSSSSGGTSGASAEASSSSQSESASAASTSSAPPASSTTQTTDSNASSAAPAIPDAAMHVQSQAGATGWFARIDIERRDDASLRVAGQEVGHMNAGRITTLDGQVVPLEGRLSIGVRGHREHLEMQPDGSVVMDMGRLTIDPSGEVQLTHGTTTRPVHVHITGYTPTTARLAALLLTYGIMKADLATR